MSIKSSQGGPKPEISVDVNSATPRRFMRDITMYSFSMGAILVMGFVQALVLPAYMEIDEFGYWRIFFLYIGYAGFVNLGFADGALLRWAGLPQKDVRSEIPNSFVYLAIQQAVILVPLGIVLSGLYDSKDSWLGVLTLFGLYITGLLTLARFTLQATLKFKKLSIANTIYAILFLAGAFILIGLDRLSSVPLILIYIISTLFTIPVMLGMDFLTSSFSNPIDLRNIWTLGAKNTRVGFFILLGNGTLLLAYTIDRLVVSWTFPVEQFAIYGFAFTFVAMIYRIVATFTDVLFPYLMKMSEGHRNKAYDIGKRIIIVGGCLALISYFPVAFFVSSFLPEYDASLDITRILLLGASVGALLRLLHVNYFKIRGQQQIFFRFGFIVNSLFLLLAFLVSRQSNMIWFAVVSVSMNLLWYLVNERYLSRFMKGKNGVAMDFLIISVYWVVFLVISSTAYPLWLQSIVYLFVALLLSILVLWPDRKWLLSIASMIMHGPKSANGSQVL